MRLLRSNLSLIFKLVYSFINLFENVCCPNDSFSIDINVITITITTISVIYILSLASYIKGLTLDEAFDVLSFSAAPVQLKLQKHQFLL